MRVMLCRCFSDGEEAGSITVLDENGETIITLDESCGLHFVDLGADIDGVVTVAANRVASVVVPVDVPGVDPVPVDVPVAP